MAELVASSPQTPDGRGNTTRVDDDDISFLSLIYGLHRLGPVSRIGAHRHGRAHYFRALAPGDYPGEVTGPVKGIRYVSRRHTLKGSAHPIFLAPDEVLGFHADQV